MTHKLHGIPFENMIDTHPLSDDYQEIRVQAEMAILVPTLQLPSCRHSPATVKAPTVFIGPVNELESWQYLYVCACTLHRFWPPNAGTFPEMKSWLAHLGQSPVLVLDPFGS